MKNRSLMDAEPQEIAVMSDRVKDDGLGYIDPYGMKITDNEPSVNIINISAGFRGFHEPLAELMLSIREVGVLPVVAVGNDGFDVARSPGNCHAVVSVGAINSAKVVTLFSGNGAYNYKMQEYKVPRVVAPGAKVYSCVPSGGYEAWDGTSMAAPIVAASAALIISKYENITVPGLVSLLYEKCERLRAVPDHRQGYGLVKVDKL